MTTARVESIRALRERMRWFRSGGIGLVPTMGALHDGHLRLIDRARDECDYVVVSIFVNPLQFDRPDDLARYPRTVETDLELCARQGVDVVFTPEPSEIYPTPPTCTVDVGSLDQHLCGPRRPGHFRGVATVVLKLFEIVKPDRAYFGEKDAQQLAVIRRMVHDFNIPIAVTGVPTVREDDGLALSSRNRHLSAAEREAAPALYRALVKAASLIEAGEPDPRAIAQASIDEMKSISAIRCEYLEMVDPESLQPVTSIERPVLVAAAAWVGSTRLIDNLLCIPPQTGLRS